MEKRVVEDRKVKFYPLIILRTTTIENAETGNSWKERRVVRNKQFDNRWYCAYLPALFGRQVGKLRMRRGKPLMELPYFACDCEGNEGCERQYMEYSPNINAAQVRKKEVDIEAIIDAELED